MRVETNGQGENHYHVFLDGEDLAEIIDAVGAREKGFKELRPKPPLKIPLDEAHTLALFPESSTSKGFREHPEHGYFWGYVNSPGNGTSLTQFKEYLDRFQRIPLRTWVDKTVVGYVSIIAELKQT